jgi:hypothetical protein
MDFHGLWVCLDKSWCINSRTTPLNGQGNIGLALKKHGSATLLNPVGGVKKRIFAAFVQRGRLALSAG